MHASASRTPLILSNALLLTTYVHTEWAKGASFTYQFDPNRFDQVRCSLA